MMSATESNYSKTVPIGTELKHQPLTGETGNKVLFLSPRKCYCTANFNSDGFNRLTLQPKTISVDTDGVL